MISQLLTIVKRFFVFLEYFKQRKKWSILYFKQERCAIHLGTEVPRILAWNILKNKFKEKILDNCQAICYNKFANNGYIISKKEGERHHDGKKIFFYYYSNI